MGTIEPNDGSPLCGGDDAVVGHDAESAVFASRLIPVPRVLKLLVDPSVRVTVARCVLFGSVPTTCLRVDSCGCWSAPVVGSSK